MIAPTPIIKIVMIIDVIAFPLSKLVCMPSFITARQLRRNLRGIKIPSIYGLIAIELPQGIFIGGFMQVN